MNHPNTFLFWSSAEGLTLIGGWARAGLSLPEIAARMGIRPATLTHWRYQHPAIETALCRDGHWADAAVEHALLRKALGYTVTETCEEDSPSGTKSKTSEKYIPPDLSAITLWLRTRRPDIWGENTSAPRDGIIRDILEAVKPIE